jgi:excisionase family DNA binding protein
VKTELKSSNDALLRKKQVAEKLACSSRTVDRLANSGRLTRIKCAGVRFRESEVQAIIGGSEL